MAEQGYGHNQPGDSASEMGAISAIVRSIVARLDTMKLVKVAAVKGGGEGQPAGTVDVIPLVSQVDGNGYGTPHGTVPGIPWSRMQSGKNGVICDPVVGDIGYVVAADRDTSKVRSTKAAALPGSGRTFNIADGVYAGALLGDAPTCYVLFKADGHLKFVDVDGNVIESSATGWSITPKTGQSITLNGNVIVTGNLQLAGAIQSQPGSLYTGNIVTSGNVIAGSGTGDQVGLQTHKHPTAGTGAPSSPTPGT
jgi:hypothetical protein